MNPLARRLTVVTGVAAIVSITAVCLHAQPALDPLTAGRHYILVFPDSTGDLVPTPTLPAYTERSLIFTYSSVPTQLTVGPTGARPITVTLSPGEVSVIDLRSPELTSWNYAASEPACSPQPRAVFLDAADPVIVHCMVSSRYGSEAWTPLPVESWGNEYFAAAHRGEIVKDVSADNMYATVFIKLRPAPAQIVVIAAYDETHVSVRPTGAIGCASVPTTINRGDVVLVPSYVDTAWGENQADVAGTTISADKPIGVMSGNTRAQLIAGLETATGNATRNMMVEWLSPSQYHGTEFAYMPICDSRRPTGAPDDRIAEKRSAELVRTYGTGDSAISGTIICGGSISDYPTPIEPSGVLQNRHIPGPAALHRTSGPAQVMLSPVPISVLRELTSGEQMLTCWSAMAVESSSRAQLKERHWCGVRSPYNQAQPRAFTPQPAPDSGASHTDSAEAVVTSIISPEERRLRGTLLSGKCSIRLHTSKRLASPMAILSHPLL